MSPLLGSPRASPGRRVFGFQVLPAAGVLLVSAGIVYAGWSLFQSVRGLSRHGDVPSIEDLRRDLKDALDRVDAGGVSLADRATADGEVRPALVLENAFPAGSASLERNPRARTALRALAAVLLRSYEGSRLEIEGHTDADPIRKGRWESNEALSLARAEAVRGFLVEAGLSRDRIEVRGLGGERPLNRGETSRAKAGNRRIEVFPYVRGE